MAIRNRNIRRPKQMSAGGILQSTAAGAGAGSVAGPVGTIAGGIVGLGKGIADSLTEKKLLKEQEELQGLQDRQLRGFNLQNRFNSSYIGSPQNIPLMPFGGAIPASTSAVELEKGEPFMTPDGNIEGVSNTAPTHAQGGVPLTLPNGTKVLGKKPATSEATFKQLGSKLLKQQDKYQKILDNKPTRIQEKTAGRMLQKIENNFNELFEYQEEVKSPNTGNQYPEGGLIPSNINVGQIPGYRATGDSTIDARNSEYFYKQWVRSQQQPTVNDFNSVDNGDILEAYPIYSNDTLYGTSNVYKGVPGPILNKVGNPAPARVESYELDGVRRLAGSEIPPKFYEGGSVSGVQYFANNPDEVQRFQSFAGLPQDNIYGENTMDAFSNLGQDYLNVRQGKPALQSKTVPTSYQQEGLDLSNFNTGQGASPIGAGSIAPNMEGFKGAGNLGNILGTIGSLAPTAYNLMQGASDPEEYNASDYYNPYENEVRSIMKSRRFNIQPGLESNRLNQATAYRNLREASPSKSQYLGGLQAAATNKTRQDAALISQQQNVNNQYLAEQAQVDASLGAQRASTDLNIDTINEQGRAATRNFTATGLTQLGQFSQNKQQMNNQMIRDAQKLNLLPALVQNFELGEDGTWVFKGTGESVDTVDVMNFIKGQNIQ